MGMMSDAVDILVHILPFTLSSSCSCNKLSIPLPTSNTQGINKAFAILFLTRNPDFRGHCSSSELLGCLHHIWLLVFWVICHCVQSKNF